MLNTKELTKLLNANVHKDLFPAWLIMTPNATLLAYSGSPNIKQCRAQATLLSQIWKENSERLRLHQSMMNDSDPAQTSISEVASNESSTGSLTVGALETLTIESPTSNIIIRAIQPRLLLIMIGGSPPDRDSEAFKVVPEARGDVRYPPAVDDGDEVASDVKLLELQRLKIDAATGSIKDDFDIKGFIMPEESVVP